MIKIKAIGNIENLSTDRLTVINKYKDIKCRWEKGLKYSYPSRFDEICKIIEDLENGEDFEIINAQSEQVLMIMNTGSLFGKQEVLHSVDKHIK